MARPATLSPNRLDLHLRPQHRRGGAAEQRITHPSTGTCSTTRWGFGKQRGSVHLASIFHAATGEPEAMLGKDSVAEVEGMRDARESGGPGAHCFTTLSLDTRITKARAKKRKQDKENLPAARLAHKSCNTGKGSTDPVVPWPDQLIVVDAAPIIAAAGRLERKGGREAMARCPTREDADAVSAWLIDRLSRLCPDMKVHTVIATTGGQYLVSLHTR